MRTTIPLENTFTGEFLEQAGSDGACNSCPLQQLAYDYRDNDYYTLKIIATSLPPLTRSAGKAYCDPRSQSFSFVSLSTIMPCALLALRSLSGTFLCTRF